MSVCACVEHECVGVHYCARGCVGGVCMCGWVGVCMHVCVGVKVWKHLHQM